MIKIDNSLSKIIADSLYAPIIEPLSWHLTGDQSSLSGTKSGTYNLSTSGTLSAGAITGTLLALTNTSEEDVVISTAYAPNVDWTQGYSIYSILGMDAEHSVRFIWKTDDPLSESRLLIQTYESAYPITLQGSNLNFLTGGNSIFSVDTGGTYYEKMRVNTDGLWMYGAYPIYFGDSGTYIYQGTDGHLSLTADVSIDLNTPILNSPSITLLGIERVLNGGFLVDGGWIWGSGWTWDSTHHEADGLETDQSLSQDIDGGTKVDKTYMVSYTIKNAGLISGIYFTFGGGTGTTRYVNGTYYQLITASTTGILSFQMFTTEDRCSITDVSVREIGVLTVGVVTAYSDIAATKLNLTNSTNQIVLDSDGTYTGTITLTDLLTANRIYTLPNLGGTIPTTATSPIAISATGVITHASGAAYKHIPTAGASGQLLINSAGTSGTAKWGTVTEASGALASVTTIGMSGALTFGTATSGIILKQGANGLCGTFTANGVTPVTVSSTAIAISDAIIISLNTVGGTVGVQPHIATITAGTSFTVICTALDTSIYNWTIIKNAS